MQQKTQQYLKAKFPERKDLSVVTLERKSGGYSYETYFLTVTWQEDGGPVSGDLVIRMEPEYGLVPPYDIRPQFEALKRVYGTGVPVPKVYWLEMDSSVLGRPFFLMERVAGEDLFPLYMKNPGLKKQLEKDYITILARLHGLDWQALGLSVLGVPENDRQFAETQIARWEKVIEDNQYGPQPVMAELVSWLKRNMPHAARTTLCHGDYGAQNLFARDDRIAAVFDWEIVGIGDPISDVAWACLLAGLTRFWNEADLVRGYEEASGLKIDEKSLIYWKVFAHVKGAAMTFAGMKAGLEMKDLDIRSIAMSIDTMPVLQSNAARMLGF